MSKLKIWKRQQLQTLLDEESEVIDDTNKISQLKLLKEETERRRRELE